MFCQECGKKNTKESKFCEECGAKLVSNTKKNDKKPMNKKNKTILIIVATILILIVSAFAILSNRFKPANVAKEYFVAVTSGNTDKLYNYFDVKNSDFTSKKIFKKVVILPKAEIVNYSVGEGKISEDGLTMEVPINYITNTSKTSNKAVINLMKDKKNKFLFFDNWKVSNESSELKTDFSIYVPKKSKVILEGINLDKKYLKKNDNSQYDEYVIPQIFKGKYKAIATLKSGLSLESDVNISGSSAYLSSLKLSSKDKEKIEKKLPEIINTIYKNAIDKKAFGDIKKDYDYDGAKLDNLEKGYVYLMNGTTSSGLKKFNTKSAKITSSKTSGSYISVTVKLNFEYTATKSLLGEEKTNSKEDEDIIYLDFDYFKGEYKLVDISSWPKYFSVF
ncbi:MAG: zinc-ribbon domain-containing protein [Bacilli bacterium]|nr:zinc-ribbon domain-containing protein [Bacilli bacterium]